MKSAQNRLDEAIAHAEKLAQEGKVVSKADFEKQEVQKRLLQPELEAGNPVKPVGNYQLPSKNLVVDWAQRQAKSFFMRDMFGNITKKDWFN